MNVKIFVFIAFPPLTSFYGLFVQSSIKMLLSPKLPKVHNSHPYSIKGMMWKIG